ncbi:hypothetical protein BB559_004277 [Furculomyces boomerangus]|uniref:Peptidase S26 domain-containing protein n=2 Tax=Harpellales TaxID=61421 RepID=A0A2T9Y2A5_9FUNG|nr:hypothetical protein BB559_006496 [Furculomyces boomerangus]PVU91146.1 hypothetical protein BB559_004277 [Furculomyces boomerangus]PWA01462.1 hypothetical protein BB558_002436 [Smittium angustum]
MFPKLTRKGNVNPVQEFQLFDTRSADNRYWTATNNNNNPQTNNNNTFEYRQSDASMYPPNSRPPQNISGRTGNNNNDANNAGFSGAVDNQNIQNTSQQLLPEVSNNVQQQRALIYIGVTKESTRCISGCGYYGDTGLFLFSFGTCTNIGTDKVDSDCNNLSDSDTYYVLMSSTQFGNYSSTSPVCGKCMLISGPGGKVRAKIVGQCKGNCASGDIMLSSTAFSKITVEDKPNPLKIYRMIKILPKVVFTIQVGCFAHMVNEWFGNFSFCRGESMLPTFNVVGDVVASINPLDPETQVMKRILGLSGDVICIDPLLSNTRYVKIPKGHVWLQGDNTSNSVDSRIYGPVPIGLLKGKVLFKVWPNFTKISSNVEFLQEPK